MKQGNQENNGSRRQYLYNGKNKEGNKMATKCTKGGQSAILLEAQQEEEKRTAKKIKQNKIKIKNMEDKYFLGMKKQSAESFRY